AVLLGLIGLVGVVAMLVSLAVGAEFWSDTTSDVVISLGFFALTFVGAVGFVVMDRSPWLGAALGVLGGLAIAVLMFWAILPIVIGLGAAVVAVLRARALQHGSTVAPSAA
ncbi:MAG: hypothetical protein ACRDOZ_15290, partial [Nocardioides sp.]